MASHMFVLLLVSFLLLLYWLLSTSVREKGPLGFHRQSLSLDQVGLSYRNCRGVQPLSVVDNSDCSPNGLTGVSTLHILA